MVNCCRHMTGVGMGKCHTDEARLAKGVKDRCMECFKNARKVC